IVDITRDKGTKGFRVLARPATSSLVGKELDAINVLESLLGMVLFGSFNGEGLNLLILTLCIERFHLPHIIFVWVGVFEAQFFYKGLFDDVYVSVFTKYKGDHDPMVGGTHLSVGAMIAHKRLVPPLVNLGCGPLELLTLPGVFSGFVSNVFRGKNLSLSNG